ncbi:unnamed protein product [Sympodiomycopsis kandeliae]
MWLSGRQLGAETARVSSAVREKSLMKATRTPGSITPSLRGGQGYGLLCISSLPSPSELSYQRQYASTAVEPLLVHGRNILQDSDMASRTRCTAHTVKAALMTVDTVERLQDLLAGLIEEEGSGSKEVEELSPLMKNVKTARALLEDSGHPFGLIVKAGGTPATGVHYLIKWTLEEVEAALHLRITGSRNTPLAPIMAFYAGCMVHCSGGVDQAAIMQAWSKARQLLRAVNIAGAYVKVVHPQGDAWELRVDFRQDQDGSGVRAWKLYYVRAPLHIDLGFLTQKLRRPFQAVMDADWPGWRIVVKWDFSGDYVDTVILPAIEREAGYGPLVDLNRLLGNTPPGSLATAWQSGRGSQTGLQAATAELKRRATIKATETWCTSLLAA